MSLSSGSLNLDYLKKQAKVLLKAFRVADPQAQRRVEAHLPRFLQPSVTLRGGRNFVLADALLIVAREAGFSSWMKLKAHVEAMSQKKPSLPELALHLADLATRRDSAGLAQYFSSLPRRDILAVRGLVVEQGNYALLVEGLLGGLRHRSAKVRYDCAHALDHLADERCIEPLRRLLDDPVPRVRRMALHVLSCDICKLNPLPMKDDLVSRVIDYALTDPSINVRRHATVALGSLCADVRASRTLETLIAQESDQAILREARRALRCRTGASTFTRGMAHHLEPSNPRQLTGDAESRGRGLGKGK